MAADEHLSPAQMRLPGLPDEEIDLPGPPILPELPEGSVFFTLIPVMGIVVMALFYLLRADNPLFIIPLSLLAVFTIGGAVLSQQWRKRDHERRRAEASLNYIRLLDRKRARLQAAHDAQRALLSLHFPDAESLLPAALSQQSLWEQRADQATFGAFRIGLGRIPSQISIRTPDPDTPQSEELSRAFQLAAQYRHLEAAPVALRLRDHNAIGWCGPRSVMMKAVRAALCQLMIGHLPQDLRLVVLASRAQIEEWRWLEWLPHSSASLRSLEADFLAWDGEQIHNLTGSLSQLLDSRMGQNLRGALPHILVIVDGPQLIESEPVYATLLQEGRNTGATLMCLASRSNQLPGDCDTIIELDLNGGFRCQLLSSAGEWVGEVIDQMPLEDAEQIARALAAASIRETTSSERVPRQVDFLDLYGVHQVEELDTLMQNRWLRPIPKGILPHPVPIGRESLAAVTEMLLDEDHHGPHGVLAGTTGSGKSELLQTLICALALEHDPRLLNFLLIDFKGGSAFGAFAMLPHTVGMVTNLDGALIERTLEALKAETQARQQFLKRMNVRDIAQYHRYFSRTAQHIRDSSYQALPHLFIIVDEFAQLAREMPDFLRELVRTAQVGRSLGLHLILGTQSPMDVITDEMNANLQFRICLRVQNIEASRAMLRRPDAAYLPAGWPGRGYFQVGERGLFKEFQTAYVGGDYTPRGENDADETMVLELIRDDGRAVNLLPAALSSYPGRDLPLSDEPYTTARAIVERIQQVAQHQGVPPVAPLLLSPLEDRLTLAEAFRKTALGGWNGREWLPAGRDHEGQPVRPGSAPAGIVDDVANRTQHPLWIHLNTGDQERGTRRDGHVIVIGGPGTGKTTFLRTIALSLALLHPPDRLHLYFLSFTGGGLNEMGELPHAEAVVHGTETERVRRLLGRLIQTLNERQSGRVEGPQPVIAVFIDQYEQLRDTYYEQHMRDFERLIHEGRAAGIYLVLTASSIAAVPERLRSLVTQRIALQLGSPSDYVLVVGHVNTRVQRTLPPGRCFLYGSPPLAAQICLPSRRNSADDDRTVAHETAALVEEMRQGYLRQHGLRDAEATPEQRQSPAPLKELPVRIPLNTLPLYPAEAGEVITPLGRRDDDALSIYLLDWWEQGPHFIVSGPPGSGKTNLLQAAALSAAGQLSPDEIRFLLVDFNGRSLRALDGLKHLLRRVTDPGDLEIELIHLQHELRAFSSQGDSGAIFPRTVLMIDDYDAASEVLSSAPGLLRQLRDCARLYSEAGLHLWVAGYFERASDPFIKHLLLKRSGFGLRTRESLVNIGIRLSELPPEIMPEGRAYFCQHSAVQVIQTAWVENPRLMANRINAQIWSDHAPAHWLHPAPEALLRKNATGPEDAAAIDTQGLLEDLLGGEELD